MEKLVLGTISFRVETTEAIDPNSARAEKIANALATSLNQRLLKAFNGEVLKYRVKSEVLEVRAGSLIAFLMLHADVAVLTGAGGAAFAREYPKMREGVLVMARDIKEVTVRARLFFKQKFVTKMKGEKLLTGQEMTVEVQAKAEEVNKMAKIKAVKPDAGQPEHERAERRQKKKEPVEKEETVARHHSRSSKS